MTVSSVFWLCIFCAGWKRNTLNVLYIIPGNLLFPDPSFDIIAERVIVSPVLKLLVFSAAPDAVSPKIPLAFLTSHCIG